MTEKNLPKPMLAASWIEKMAKSNLSTQEKIDATKLLLSMLKTRDKHKAMFESRGLDRNGLPKKQPPKDDLGNPK